jgi:protein-tyrosine phosphatase
MRTWKNLLYFDAMPGRHRPIENWLSEMKAAGVNRIVCLTPQGEIVKRSTAYHLWRQTQTEYEVTDVPIPDYGVPDAAGTEVLWREAARVARDIERGKRVFIHCGAGIGRTGTFASAVLAVAGFGATEAMQEIKATGSRPETSEQVELVHSSPGHAMENWPENRKSVR